MNPNIIKYLEQHHKYQAEDAFVSNGFVCARLDPDKTLAGDSDRNFYAVGIVTIILDYMEKDEESANNILHELLS